MSLFYPVIWLIAWLDIMFYVENNIPCTFLRQFDIVFSFWCRFDFSAIFCPWHSEILQCYPWSASQFSHSVMSDSLWPPWTAACQASLSFTMSWSLLKLMSIESLMPYNHLILCRPLHLFPSIFPRIRRPKYWSFSFSISTSNEYPGLISFRIDWFDLLAVQGTLKSLLQHSSSKASILQCSAFFMVQFDFLGTSFQMETHVLQFGEIVLLCSYFPPFPLFSLYVTAIWVVDFLNWYFKFLIISLL